MLARKGRRSYPGTTYPEATYPITTYPGTAISSRRVSGRLARLAYPVPTLHTLKSTEGHPYWGDLPWNDLPWNDLPCSSLPGNAHHEINDYLMIHGSHIQLTAPIRTSFKRRCTRYNPKTHWTSCSGDMIYSDPANISGIVLHSAKQTLYGNIWYLTAKRFNSAIYTQKARNPQAIQLFQYNPKAQIE